MQNSAIYSILETLTEVIELKSQQQLFSYQNKQNLGRFLLVCSGKMPHVTSVMKYNRNCVFLREIYAFVVVFYKPLKVFGLSLLRGSDLVKFKVNKSIFAFVSMNRTGAGFYANFRISPWALLDRREPNSTLGLGVCSEKKRIKIIKSFHMNCERQFRGLLRQSDPNQKISIALIAVI